MTIAIESASDRVWLRRFFEEPWGGPAVVSGGGVITADEVSRTLIAKAGPEIIGCVTWRDEGDEREIVAIDALKPREGVGTVLIDALIDRLRKSLRRLRLVTTNDNLDALRFYQRRGWRIARVRPGAIGESRRLKPAIPETGAYGIPVNDEIDLEYLL